MNTDPKVFIVVLNYNGGELLKNCLNSLSQITYSNFSILVTDNDSKDGSLEEVRSNYKNVLTLSNSKNLGFAGGNNVGISYALARGAEYVLLLNQDTVVTPNFLDQLIASAKKNPRAGILTPFIYWKSGPEIWFAGGKINWLTMKSSHQKNMLSEKPYYTSFITGCSMLVKKEVFDRIGLLDDSFFLYWEDADFCIRAQRANFLTMLVPQSKIYHHETSGPVKGKKLYWLVLSGLRFFHKNASPWRLPWIKFYCLLRKLKNRVDVLFFPNDDAKIVQQAYLDFENEHH